jgi:CelD/BcsL family acetyltransferase involved in cellulose biosynthesis
MYSADLVCDSTAFAALKEEWNAAADRAGIAHPFLRHEWLRAWWDAFGNHDTQQLHVVVVRRGTRVCAIAPLMFERAQMYGVPVRRLRLLQNDHTPRADVIVADANEDAYRAIWQTVKEGSRHWDVLQLNQLPVESGSRDMFRRLAAFDGQHTGVWESGAAPYLALRSTFSAYKEGLGAKFRQNLRNRLSRLSHLGEPAFEVIDDPAAIRASREDAERLEESGWKAGEGTAIRSDQSVKRFYTLLTDRAEECSWLRLLFLTVDGRRIAGAYAAVYANRLFLLKTGYDPAFAKCSPFKLLTYFALEYAFEQGFCELDFLGDTEPWKLEWTSTTRAHDWLFIFAGTPRGRLLHPLKFQFVPAIRQCSSRLTRA